MATVKKSAILGAAQDISEWIIDLRRKIHEWPELGFDCCETAALVRKTLCELNIHVYDEAFAKTGVVARIGSGNGPCIALRADMDALPIQELYEWPHQSKRPNIMHACGHDAHVAMLLGAARLLQEHYEQKGFEGTVLLIFQPAEEGGAPEHGSIGAKVMVEEGALKNAEAIFGLHVSDAAPAGVWASKAGTLMAGAAMFNATIVGNGGHGARPQEAIDPIVASAFVVTSIQPIISRETDPAEMEVISVGSIHGGEANNVIPDYVTIGGTFRHVRDNEEALTDRKDRIINVIEDQAKVHRCTTSRCIWDPLEYPALVNGKDTFEFARDVVLEVLPDPTNKVWTLDAPTTASEDFPYFLKKVPGAFAFVGCRAPFPGGKTVYGVHNARFVLDEACLAYGAAIHTALAIEYITNPREFDPPTRNKSILTHGLRKIGKHGS